MVRIASLEDPAFVSVWYGDADYVLKREQWYFKSA